MPNNSADLAHSHVGVSEERDFVAIVDVAGSITSELSISQRTKKVRYVLRVVLEHGRESISGCFCYGWRAILGFPQDESVRHCLQNAVQVSLVHEMCFRPRFSDQALRNRGAYRPNPQDLYMKSMFRCGFPVQTRLVHCFSGQTERALCPITCTLFIRTPAWRPFPASSVHKSTAQCPCPCTLRECTTNSTLQSKRPGGEAKN